MIKRVSPTSRQFDRLEKFVTYELNGDATTAVQAAFTNDEGRTVLVTRVLLYVTTVATAACTVDIGKSATVATADSFLDGVDVNAGIAVFDSADSSLDSAANDQAQILASGEYVTVDPQKTGACAGLRATVYIGYIVA
jgi:hypothetical protein